MEKARRNLQAVLSGYVDHTISVAEINFNMPPAITSFSVTETTVEDKAHPGSVLSRHVVVPRGPRGALGKSDFSKTQGPAR